MKKRDENLKKQLKASFIFRALAIVFSFLIVRYMLEYLGAEQYGIWSIILSFTTWILFFDLGIANGVKNKVSESLALGKNQDVKEFISTGYIILTIFSIIVYVLFLIISYYINWQSIFNTNTLSSIFLGDMLRITLFFILINFILSIIIAIFNAVQTASLVIASQFLSTFLSVIMIVILLNFTTPNLLYLSISYGFILVFSNIILSIWFYNKNPQFIPKIKFFKIKKVKSISSLGINFFFLQLTIFFILSTDKFLIAQLLDLSNVTTYDILYKYFGVILIIHGIINSPLWSIYTEAYIRNDYIWISKTLKNMIKLCIGLSIILIFMIISANFIIKIWMNNSSINFILSNYIYMAIMIILIAWYGTFAYFTNGIGKTKIQLYSALIGASINIPLSVLFVKYYNMELNGILLSTIISLLIFGILGPIQAIREIKLMKNKKIKND